MGVSGNAGKVGAAEDGVLQGSGFAQRFFGLLAGTDIAQDAGEVKLTAQRHLAGGDFEGEEAAVLAKTHNLAALAQGAGLRARTVMFQRHMGLLLVQLGHEKAEGLASQLCGAVAKHFLNGGIGGFHGAAQCVQRDNAVAHRIQYGLHPRCAVAQGLLGCVFSRHIAKH